MKVIATDRKTGLQTVSTRDGAILARKYMYLKPETWSALQKLATAGNTNISSIIEKYVNSDKELPHDNSSRTRIN